MEHDDPNGMRLAPKKTDQIVWRFTQVGVFEYFRLIPGHREAGMIGTSSSSNPRQNLNQTKGKKMKLNKLAAATLALSIFVSLAASAEDAMVKGVVKKIDAGAGKITLTSGPIKSLDMDEDNMTMVFRVQDPAMLKQVKVGDKVQFAAGLVNGEIAVTSLQKSK